MNQSLPLLLNIAGLLFAFGLGHLIGGFHEWNKPEGTSNLVKENHNLRKLNAQLRHPSTKGGN